MKRPAPVGRRRSRRLLLGRVAVLATIVACGRKNATGPPENGRQPFTNVPAPPSGVARFSVLPAAIAPGMTLTAIGSLNPPGHVLPTTHVYFYDWDLSAGGGAARDVRNVYMPADGSLFFVLQQSGGDYKVMFRATSDFYFFLDHVIPTVPLTSGKVYSAGTQLGTTSPGGTLDLGAFDATIEHAGFLRPERYSAETQRYVSPWKYFTPELQAQIYPHVYRAPGASDRDGRADFDVAGHLVGNWFLRGMPVDSSEGPYGWTRTVAFVYDYYDPSQVRISIGGTVAPAGVWAIEATAPPPAQVTVQSGLVAYRLYSPFDKGFPPTGLMLVQMVNDSTISIEVFAGSNATAGGFDGHESTFVR